MSTDFLYQIPNSSLFILILIIFSSSSVDSRTIRPNSSTISRVYDDSDSSVTYLWPLPSEFTSGNETLLVDPDLSLSVNGNGGHSPIVREAFERYRAIIFKRVRSYKFGGKRMLGYDISKLTVIVHSSDEELQLGVDESYTLLVAKNNGLSIIGEVIIEANTVYGALRGLETFSQLCGFDYGTKTVQVYKAPWFIRDKPRFVFRGLLLDTSRHYYPVEIIKQIIESMCYAKLNVLHWHIIDEESFPLEVPAYRNLWKGAYTKWERYTVEDAKEIVKFKPMILDEWLSDNKSFAKMRGINVMAEIDVPGHAESWGTGYPDLWPSDSCKEPLDVSKNFTFDVLSGILTDMRQIFPFELFHLGGDEVNTDCWSSTPHVKQWLQEKNMTTKDAYQYFVLRAQEIAISKSWTPVNWEETFNTFASKLSPKTIVHNWLGPGVCPKVVAKGFKCIYSNQGVWYLDHLDITWDGFYDAEPLEGITDASEQELVLGGEVCMWSETADPSNVQQTIWPRAAAAAERLWTSKEAAPTSNTTKTVLARLQYFKCLLTRRGVQASPVTNQYARSPPIGPGSCYEQ